MANKKPHGSAMASKQNLLKCEKIRPNLSNFDKLGVKFLIDRQKFALLRRKNYKMVKKCLIQILFLLENLGGKVVAEAIEHQGFAGVVAAA